MNKKIFLALFTSEIGNSFYILFVSVVLLKLGYSVGFVSSSIAITVLPNLIFGPWLGKMVDYGNKKRIHLYLNISLALVVNLIGGAAFFLDHSIGKFVIPFLMVIYNCLFSPLNTIIYHYVVPDLDENEAKAFIKWEKYRALGIFLSSIISFVVIKFDLHYWLLPIDGFTFVFCSLVIDKGWMNKIVVSKEGEDGIRFNLKNSMIENFSIKLLLISILSCLFFIFFVDSHTYNAGVLFFKELKAPLEYIPLLISSISLVNILGTLIFEKYLINVNNNKTQILSLIWVSLGLSFLSFGIYRGSLFVTILSLVLIQVIEPIWSTTNNIMMRSQIKDGAYGEFFGYFKILRSLVTFAGIYLYGVSQEANFLSTQVAAGAFLILTLPVIYYAASPEKSSELEVCLQ